MTKRYPLDDPARSELGKSIKAYGMTAVMNAARHLGITRLSDHPGDTQRALSRDVSLYLANAK